MPPAKMIKPQGGSAAHTSGIFADMTVDGPIIGDLVVVVDRARNLPNRKTMGKQDPYCAARLGKEAKKTETDRRGGQTPRWDQELRFVVHESPDYLKLKLSVFNEDRKTDLIGETWVDLKDVIVRGGGQNDSWHKLNCKGRPSGEVRMEITFYDTREKPADTPAKPSRQAEKLNGGPRALLGRRPLPRGPGGEEPPRDPLPHSTSASHIPSRPHPRPEAAHPRHMSIDAIEQGPVDPYKHRQKMLATYGLPYDPTAQVFDERLTHHGGPRPVPGQSFSDLDRLRYRNRGVAIPEGLIQEGHPQRPRTNTHEAAPTQLREMEVPHDIETPAEEETMTQQHYRNQPQPQAQAQAQSQHPYPAHHEFSPQQYQITEQQPYDQFDHSLHSEETHSGYQQPYVEPEPEEDEGPPPPPPVHRSHITHSNPAPTNARYEPEPPAPSLQHGLARLNAQNGDDFYHPMENSTQLTTHSDVPAPGYADAYNHGHRATPRYSQTGRGQYPDQHPAHQRSMQDMRGHHQESRRSQFDTYTRDGSRNVHRISYDSRNEVQDGYRSSGPPPSFDAYETLPSQIQGREQQGYDSGYDSFEQEELSNSYAQPEHMQHQHAAAPIVKPRPISPNTNSPHYQPPLAQSSSAQNSPNHTTVYNSSTIQRKSIEPRISDTAFSPDSFDVLNPQVKARLSMGNPDTMTQAPYANHSILDTSSPDQPTASNDPIRDSLGRLVDPSDHLPTHTWAPEPEPKKPLKAEVKLRFKGAVPMPASGPRAARPDVPMPAVKSSVFSPHLTERPGETATPDGKPKENRSRLQKKVRVMMTSGGRKERKAERQAAEMDSNLAWAADAESKRQVALRDIPDVNYGGRGEAPVVPAKVPLDSAGYEENVLDVHMGSGVGTDALSRELSSIDLGAYGGRGARRPRYATTLM